jgi:hypothetical protein
MKATAAAFVARLTVATAMATELSSPDDFLRATQSIGPAKFAQSLLNTPAYDRLIDGVGSGEKQWFAVAGLLRPHTDAGFSSELEVALISALGRAPDSVVLFLSQYHGPSYTFEIGSVCGDRAMQESADYYRNILKTLRAVRHPSAPRKMKQCIAAAKAAARSTERQ